MKRFLMSCAVVLGLTVVGGYAYQASADPNPPGAPDQPPGPTGPPGPWSGPGHDHWRKPGRGPMGDADGWGMDPGPGWPAGRGPERDDKFGLFAPVDHKNLSDADVKTIASALLLEHGNHNWTVGSVVTQPDKLIQFSFNTPHGDVIATFAIDPDSGKITRVS